MSEDENVFAALEKRASAWGIPLQVRTLDANEYRAAIAVGDAVIVYAPFDGGNLYQSGPMTTKKALKFGNSLITWTVDEGFKHNLGKPLASNVVNRAGFAGGYLV
jgi:hypothetical protein